MHRERSGPFERCVLENFRLNIFSQFCVIMNCDELSASLLSTHRDYYEYSRIHRVTHSRGVLLSHRVRTRRRCEIVRC